MWADSAATFASQVLGPHVEDLARAWTARHAAEGTLGGRVGAVGVTTVDDRRGRIRHEVDVLALAAEAGHRRRVLLVGEAKASGRPCGIDDLRRLERVRDLLRADDRVDADDARLALFARGGFDAALLGAARPRPDVVLVDLERLYEGA